MRVCAEAEISEQLEAQLESLQSIQEEFAQARSEDWSTEFPAEE